MTSDLPRVVFRVDPRLVHATLMNAWVPATKAEWLLIADAKVLADSRRRTIYRMSAAESVEVHFVAEPGVGAKLDTLGDRPGIVVFSSLTGVLRAMRGGLALQALNVGHVPIGPGRSEVHPAVYLGSGDLEMLRQLESVGVRVSIQPLPDDSPIRPDLGTDDLIPAAAPPRRASSVPSALAPSAPPPKVDVGDLRAQAVLEVVNDRGLHLRAAHVLAALCNQLSAKVMIGKEGEMVNAKSLLGLTTLGAARGSRLTVIVDGEDAGASMERLRELFASGFTEGLGIAP